VHRSNKRAREESGSFFKKDSQKKLLISCGKGVQPATPQRNKRFLRAFLQKSAAYLLRSQSPFLRHKITF
jgi:hypothetical protein